jgi:Rap1a immunity proteins
MPPGVTYEQGVRIVIAYIEARPRRLHESFGLLAREALMAAWPCTR